MNQNEIIGQLVANSIILTAQLANEVCIQTRGEFIVPESDYIHLVKEFQVRLAKRLMPVKTNADVKEEASKFISELLSKNSQEDATNELSNGESPEGSEDKEVVE
jgi:hypothetical protein